MNNKASNVKVNSKWRNKMYNACLVMTLISFLTELGFLFVYIWTDHIGMEITDYVLRYIVFPLMVNVISLIVTYNILDNEKYSDSTQNRVMCLAIFLMCSVIECVHYIFITLMCMPLIAIFMTILFADINLCRLIFALSYFPLIITGIQNYFDERTDNFYLVLNCVVIALINFCCYLVVSTLIKHEVEQQDNISESHAVQVQLMEKVKRDPLTDLYNREGLINAINLEIEMQKKYGYNVQIAILDIDNFKNINDTFGHVNGDEVLIKFANIIKKHITENEKAFRYGGEEFVILFQKKTLEEAYELVEKIHKDLQVTKFTFTDTELITFSCGIAPYIKSWTDKEWFNHADDLLYEAKRMGKNRTIKYA